MCRNLNVVHGGVLPSWLMFRWIGFLLLNTAVLFGTPDPIRHEPIRMQALRAIFPGMSISEVVGLRIDNSWRPDRRRNLTFPDALKEERVYHVIGDAANQTERCAAEDVVSQTISKIRVVRFQVYPWPRSNGTSDLLVVVQYRVSFRRACVTRCRIE